MCAVSTVLLQLRNAVGAKSPAVNDCEHAHGRTNVGECKLLRRLVHPIAAFECATACSANNVQRLHTHADDHQSVWVQEGALLTVLSLPNRLCHR
jgi:hypothetical protein